MAPGKVEEFPDSDSDVEFEDVPINHGDRSENVHVSASRHSPPWTPTLLLPPQRAGPLASGSEEETQLRGQISTGVERVTYRKMKSDMGMDAPDTPPTHRRYDTFAQLADDVNGLIDMLWASATPAIQTEALITLAGLTQTSLPSFSFSAEATLSIFHKFDCVFAALCTGTHPTTGVALPGAVIGQSLVTETQKVRIRSLAERTRHQVFSLLTSSSTFAGDEDGDEELDEVDEPWMLEATKVYEKSLMLLAEQNDVTVEGDEFTC
ncbi:unnamed protein product [Penicillium olsonii]|uniref:Uncharacterized protein n=1 Tax=Penicillium olsonii TaxID=99116 RepID=A0A9W4I130_PENOL|nr:unnamed protein product [Penicillium olsonii]CAG8220214.1 unnamed protein product [Penicillium olsonii]CAG8234496.1 unnamed protein product [Penicillium olsonii]